VTRVSICMATASVDHPMPQRQESIYELLRLSIANQTYDGPIEVIVADAATVRLAHEFRAPWDRADRVVLTKQVLHDRIAISGARNTAAVYARGDLLVFVDDCTELLPSFIKTAVKLHERGEIPTRLLIAAGSNATQDRTTSTRKLLRAGLAAGHFEHVDPVWRQHGCPTDKTTWTLSGQAGGVFVLARELFLRLNGFDENFDGNWGCEDIEFWTRVDRLRLPRVGRADLAVLRWAHQPTPSRVTIKRCREAYAQWAYRSSRIEANRSLSDAVLDELQGGPPCTPTCGICNAPDRAQQIETYRTIPADFDLRKLHAVYSSRPSGIYLDSWR
jgi:glycosyltransferase involved in cell wall biosynthesis